MRMAEQQADVWHDLLGRGEETRVRGDNMTFYGVMKKDGRARHGTPEGKYGAKAGLSELPVGRM